MLPDRPRLLLALFPLALLAAPALAADNTPPPGFEALFNGKDLRGWTVPEADGGHWRVADGVIDYDARSESKGVKDLWTEREFGDFTLLIDWRLKEAPFVNPNVPYVLPDGTHAKDVRGKEIRLALPDADSGVFLRGDGFYQANIWCWPIGSGEIYSVRTDRNTPPALKAAVTPVAQADRPVGEWNHFEITARGKTVSVSLNGKAVIPGATIPGIPARGRLGLQHHGSWKDGAWAGPPSLVQFKNVYVKTLDPAPANIKAVLVTGGHEHDVSFYHVFQGCPGLDRLPVLDSAAAFQGDLRGKYDVVILYDFTREPGEAARRHLREFVEAGGGVVVLHHALLDFQGWDWWCDEAVGGSYRLSRSGSSPSSSVKDGQEIDAVPAGGHPVTAGLAPFHIRDEAYKNMRMSPKIKPLVTTDNPACDRALAWVGPTEGARVVAVQLGHGPSAFANPSYRTLVHNAVAWAAGRAK